jgi:hypothetical protein
VSTKSRGHSCYCRKSGRLLLLHQETGSQAKNDLPTLNDDIILVPCVKPRVSPSDLQSDHKCFQTGRAYTRLLRVVCHSVRKEEKTTRGVKIWFSADSNLAQVLQFKYGHSALFGRRGHRFPQVQGWHIGHTCTFVYIDVFTGTRRDGAAFQIVVKHIP